MMMHDEEEHQLMRRNVQRQALQEAKRDDEYIAKSTSQEARRSSIDQEKMR